MERRKVDRFRRRVPVSYWRPGESYRHSGHTSNVFERLGSASGLGHIDEGFLDENGDPWDGVEILRLETERVAVFRLAEP